MKRRRPTRKRCLWSRVAAPLLAASALTAVMGYAVTPGAAQVLLQADQVTYDSTTQTVTARGHVEISDDGRVLRADRLSYDQRTNRIGASGHVSLTEANGDIVAFADEVNLSGDLREGALKGFAALLGKNGRLAGISGRRWDGRYTEARGVLFTPCKLCAKKGETTPVWQIKAARVVHDQVEHELTFEDASLEFLGLPIAYLPIFSTADPTVTHKTGFLLPTIGSSTYLGTFVQAPYYIAFSDSQDATIEPYITSNAGTVVRGEYRQRWAKGGLWLQGSIGYNANALRTLDEGAWMSHLFGSGRIPINDHWRVGFDVQLTSNDTYLRRYDISYLDRLTSDVFTDAVWGRSRAEATSYFFQSLRPGESAGTMPLVLPYLEYTYIPEHKIYGGRLKVDSSALSLTRTEGANMLRGSMSGDWLRQFIADNGQLFTVEAFVRTDLYHITNAKLSVPTAPMNTETISRGLGYASLEWRWPFVNEMSFDNTTLVVEPIVQLVAATGGGNPAGLPNEDSTTFEFDDTNLFIPNEFPGLDLWTGGPRANVGVRATAFFPTGSVEAMLGQEYRTRRDPNFAPGSGVGDERSDIVGRIKIDFPPHIELVHRFRYDPVRNTLRRNEIYLTAHYGRSTLNLSYLKLAQETSDPSLGPREEVSLTTTIAFYGHWAVFAETRRDLEKGRTLDSGAGLIYDDECFMAQLGFRRRDTTDRDFRPSSSVILKLGLKTGQPGDNNL